MNCPVCGQPLDINDAICPNCGSFSLPLRETVVPDAPVPAEPAAAGLYSPPEDLFDADTSHPAERGPRRMSKRFRRMLVLAIVACCVAVISLGVAVYITVSTSSLQVRLNKAQKESSTAAATAQELEAQVGTLTEQLDEARAENQSLGARVAELQAQVGSMESSVNQSQYDKESAQRELEQANSALSAATAENEQLEKELRSTQDSLAQTQDELDSVTSERDELSAENRELSGKVQSYEAEIEFFDTYVVFVMLSSADKYYHRYSCPNFTQRNFLAYSVRLAEANGYTPCPVCIGD